ncbi:MAG TPA: aminoglycoside phosphotransferase family protein [Ktedonobacteraceae bacterium]|nr:aminoglycoside phosphotransferase family protein [Ktedonobacteraceae bacterium]
MREPPKITEEDLRACLLDQYDLSPITLTFLPLGHDYDAGIYRVESEQGTTYALKVTLRPLYEPRYLVPRYLNDQGVASVVAPIPTRSAALWTKLGEWTVILYPFVEGDTSLTGMTNEQWEQLGSIFQRIHQVMLPSGGFASLRKETFDPTAYIRWVRAFETQHAHAQGGGASQRAIRSSWAVHQPTIHTVVTSLERLAAVLQPRPLPCVICHADLHARNLIRNQAGQVFVIDWDEVMLAPKERDFIFVRPPHADAFFQGYGQAEIDWVALTYFLWERIVQDLIECTQNVCFRDDWGEESKAEAVQLLDVILAEDRGHIDAAYQASAHLPSDLTVHRREIS